MAHVRRSRSAAHALGRRRPLTAPAAAGALVRTLNERLGSDLRDLWTDEDTVEFSIDGARNVEVLTLLRDDPDLAFFMLADEAAVDYGVDAHFEVVYHLFSWKHPAWVRVRARVDRADPRIPTITHLWEGAMFHEREMYDMMGIVFEGNRDLRRIYMSPDYRSFPQRKDFILPDDAADSSAHGVNPLERPETWDLTRFSDAAQVPGPGGDPSRPRRPTPTRADRDDEGGSRGPHPGPDRAGPRRGGSPAGGRRAAARSPRAGRVRRVRPGRHSRSATADRAGAGGLHPRRGGDADQHGAAAPLDPRRHAAGRQGARRGDRRHRPGARLPPSRDREAVRERDVHDRPDVRRPDGLPGDDAQRARAGDRLREALRDQGAEASRVHPGAGGRAEPDLQPQPDDGLPGARHGRADPDPVQLHQPRRDRRHAVRHQRAANALQLLPRRRRELGRQRRVPQPPRHLAQPRAGEHRDERADDHPERDLHRADARDGRPQR